MEGPRLRRGRSFTWKSTIHDKLMFLVFLRGKGVCTSFYFSIHIENTRNSTTNNVHPKHMVLNLGLLLSGKSWICGQLRVGVDYIEEVHRSRMLGAWRNMSGYGMGFSPTGFYTTTKTIPMENLLHGQPQTLIWTTCPLKNSNLRHYFWIVFHLIRRTNRYFK